MSQGPQTKKEEEKDTVQEEKNSRNENERPVPPDDNAAVEPKKELPGTDGPEKLVEQMSHADDPSSGRNDDVATRSEGFNQP